jgi:hypothetical protein
LPAKFQRIENYWVEPILPLDFDREILIWDISRVSGQKRPLIWEALRVSPIRSFRQRKQDDVSRWLGSVRSGPWLRSSRLGLKRDPSADYGEPYPQDRIDLEQEEEQIEQRKVSCGPSRCLSEIVALSEEVGQNSPEPVEQENVQVQHEPTMADDIDK